MGGFQKKIKKFIERRDFEIAMHGKLLSDE